MFFLVAIYWSLGAGLLEESREIFDNYCRELSTLTQCSDKEHYAKNGNEMQYSSSFKNADC